MAQVVAAAVVVLSDSAREAASVTAEALYFLPMTAPGLIVAERGPQLRPNVLVCLTDKMGSAQAVAAAADQTT